jgi:aminopeptidase N
MKRNLILLTLLACPFFAAAQDGERPVDTSWKKLYRETPTKINDLVHTRLDVKPDFSKSYLYGKAWLTLQPHFYPTDSLTLDAKYFDVKKLVLVRGTQEIPLKYENTDWELKIKLDRTYKMGEKYMVYIDYVARPDEFEKKYDQNAVLGIKGMYFINPLGEDKDKPTQIWTQGETQSSCGWFPTIDRTNQKTTEELTVTVADKYVTLSNGKLMSQKKNADGTRSDYWKMDLPHAPYLFFLGVGEYAVIKDSYKGKEVNYYVEKEYAGVAKQIFGNTPEMMGFFSRITGVEYPWVKYSQITGRDYVAGAMENTTATIHQESAQQDARELADGNQWEGTVAHELFHQWFGDYVTCENWTNLTLNESFADYSQTLWEEYKYGRDAGDAENNNGLLGYLNGGNEKKDLVRFYYNDREDMFDGVSYNKGGRILHMLRNYVGDSAFFKSLNLYLTTNKFKSAEAHQLRLAFEEVTGKDLNWYFNQWYYGSGHPKLDISYQYDDAAGKASVIVKQTQKGDKIFKLPFAIDMYNGASKVRHQVWAANPADTFVFNYTTRPDLINVDGDKILLAEKKDGKTLENYVHQYKFAGNYMDRREALDFCSKKQDDPKAFDIVKLGLTDKYYRLRNFTLNKLDMKKDAVKTGVEKILVNLTKNDKEATVRGNAINQLAKYKKAEYKPIFEKGINDMSYTIAGYSLAGLQSLDSAAALAAANRIAKLPAKGVLQEKVMQILTASGSEEAFDIAIAKFEKMGLSQAKLEACGPLGEMAGKINNTAKVKKAVDLIAAFREAVPQNFRDQTDPFLNGIVLSGIIKKKEEALKAGANAALQEQLAYAKSKMPAEK